MYRKIWLLYFCLCSIISVSQIPETNLNLFKTNWWIFGDSCGVQTLKDTSLKILTNLVVDEGSAVFSNSNGELLFYTDGITILDSNNLTINRSELNTFSSSIQTAIIVEADSHVFIVTTNPEKGVFMHCYEDTYPFDKVFENIKILRSSTEAVASSFHNNKHGSFVHTLQNNKNDLYSFYFDSTSFVHCPIVNNIGFNVNNQYCQIKPSPSGKLLAIGSADHQIDIFQSKDDYLRISNSVHIPHFVPYSIEFSQNENYLYVSSEGKKIHQFSISQFNRDSIISTKRVIAINNDYVYGKLQITGDDRIFVAQADSSFLGEIINANSSFSSYSSRGIYLSKNRKSRYGLPNFNSSYFYTPSIDYAYAEDCWGHVYSFEGRDTFDATGYKWIFEQGTQRDSILSKHCNYQFSDTGKWQVSHIAWNTSRADTVTKTLTIRPKWNDDVLGKDTFYCRPFPPSGGQADSAQGDNKFTLTLRAPSDMHCVHWNGEESNLDDALGPIVDYDHFHTDTLLVDTAGTYIVKLTNKTFCQMYDTIVVEEKPRPNKPALSQNGHKIESSLAAAEYYWYLNGMLIENTTSPLFDPNENGYWQVQLVSEFGCESELSDSFNVGFASTKNYELPTINFKVYPNPSRGQISILTDQKNYTIEIYDMEGSLLLKQQNAKNISLYKTGNFLVKIVSKNGNGTQLITIY